MSILMKIPFSARQPAIHTLKRTFFTTRPAMSRISEVIKKDHAELKEYADNIRNARDDETKVRWQNQFTWELARHSIGEELVVYPAFQKHLGGQGNLMAEKDRAEHQSVKEALNTFQKLTPSDSEFFPTLDALMKDLTEHMKEEENDDLPALETALSEDDSEALAGSFGRTKHFVPTRSHPMAPARPPFETVVGLMTAPIDKLGDMFRKFPEEKKN
ncbi:hypothetical protein GLAREA_03270 [Glarea lozoyensis ATCC 20868]|uniref:Hemerythrin-like domain-containing protein n=2 Tax=Glarea lozoyensis TaxID=101852 RepID=S3CNR1_GLAL2|nr:uncharacterized protein GLAREA_03270 [Glarea lozoyensis ATCC 20868]EHL00325.1 putative Uncharacterized hemerythrin-like protein [Glarea lozoyensis 74030]EPE27355.1 hypothetical protein GLAREA_03270 [Glarea lozoyensis ATCC 20868]